MPLVTIMCPTTGRRTSTGVEMDRRTFNALPLNRHIPLLALRPRTSLVA